MNEIRFNRLKFKDLLKLLLTIVLLMILLLSQYSSAGSADERISEQGYISADSAFKLSSQDDKESEHVKIKDQVQSVTMTEDGQYFAVGTRFHSNDKIKAVLIYKWDTLAEEYILFTKIDESKFRGNVLDLEFSDIDNNGILDLTIASSSGFVYVFEQQLDKTVFNLVWKSIFSTDMWDIEIIDIENDGLKEIIVASSKNRVHIFGIDPVQLDSNSNMWDQYQERYRTDNLKDGAISVTAVDLNNNSLLDIVIGLRHGGVLIYEESNATGIINSNHSDKKNNQCDQTVKSKDDDDEHEDDDHDDDDKQSYDLCFKRIWEDTTTLWNSIIQLETADIDYDGIEEVAVLSKGQDVMLLEYDTVINKFYLDRITLDPYLWERTGAYPIDNYADILISASNVTFNGIISEPMSWLEPGNVISPFTSGLENAPDNHFSSLASNGANITVDFGNREEVVASGNSMADININLAEAYNGSLSDIQIKLMKELDDHDEDYSEFDDNHDDKDDDANDHDDSKDDEECEEHDHHCDMQSIIWMSEDNMTIHIDIDPIVSKRHWNYVRYLSLSSNTTVDLRIESIEAMRINLRMSSVRSIFFDKVPDSNSIVLFMSTTEGKMIGFSSNYKINSWDPAMIEYSNSYEDQLYTLANYGAWDIIPNPNYRSINNWINPQLSFENLENELDKHDQVMIGPDFASSADDNAENNLYFYDGSFKMLLDPYNTNNVGLQDVPELYNVDSYYQGRVMLTFSYIYSNNIPELLVYRDNQIDIWKYVSNEYILTDNINTTMIDDKLNNLLGSVIEFVSADFNGDSFDDLLFITQSNFVYLQYNSSSGYFDYIPDYFEDVEYALSHIGLHEFTRVVKQIQAVDYDKDGDADLLINLGRRPGFTFFENQGNAWQEKRSYVNFRQPTSTFTNNDFEFGVIWNDIFFGISYNPRSQTREMTGAFWISSKLGQQSWLVVNSGEVSVIVNNFLETSSFDNWGFQYIESWNDKLLFDSRHDGHCDEDYHEYTDHEESDCDEEDYSEFDEEDYSEFDEEDYHHSHEEDHNDHYVDLPAIVVRGGDQDGDGIIDGLEGFSRINSLKTDISNFDTDGDGISDNFELSIGLDPRSGDTDKDLIPDSLEIKLDHDDHDDYDFADDCDLNYEYDDYESDLNSETEEDLLDNMKEDIDEQVLYDEVDEKEDQTDDVDAENNSNNDDFDGTKNIDISMNVNSSGMNSFEVITVFQSYQFNSISSNREITNAVFILINDNIEFNNFYSHTEMIFILITSNLIIHTLSKY